MTEEIQKNTNTNGKTFDKELLNNPQMMLLDVFSELPLSENSINTNVNVSGRGANNVPKIGKNFLKTINDMIEAEANKNANFINLLTPNEYAQLTPKIDLFLVSAKDPARQLSIPLTNPANIQKGLTSLGYYTTNNVGLKSLEMRLDGSTQALFGRTYKVNLKLLFDSINTFTDSIPGASDIFGENLTYAQVFRSAGVTGISPWFTKITISYSTGNKQINEKYALNSEALSFSLSLSLIKTNLSLEENSKTIIDVDYIGEEESLFANRELFDILNLDLAADSAVLQRQVADAKKTRDLAIKAAEIYSKSRHENFGKKFIKDIDQKIKESQQRQRSLITSDGDKNQKQANFVTARKEGKFQEELRAQRDSFVRDTEANKQALLGKATADFANTQSTAQAKFDNLRMDQISTALEETFFSAEIQKSGVIKEITISSQKIIDYYNNIISGGNVKDLLSDPGNSSKRKQPVQKITQSAQKAINVAKINKAASDIEALNQSKKELNRKILKLDAEIKELNKNSNDPAAAADALRRSQKVEGLQKQKDSLAGDLSNIDKKIKQNESTKKEASQTSTVLGGTIEQIVKEFSDFYTVRYILFGDLVRLIFNRIYNVLQKNAAKDTPGVNTVYLSKTEEIAKKTIERSRFIFANITLFAGNDRLAISRDIYDIPISIKNLKYILAKKLYGTSKNSLSVFEIMQQLINLVSVARINKARLLNVSDFNGSYQLGNITFSLTGEAPNFKIIKNSKSFADLKHGLILYARRKSDGESIIDDTSYVPQFIFGGVDRGALKKIQLEAIKDSDLEKAAFAKLNHDNKLIPLIFQVNLTTVGLPIFQLGMRFNVITPTLNVETDGKVNGWFYGEGQYQVKSVEHFYQAGGFFETKVTGLQYSTRRQVNGTKADGLSAAEAKAEEKRINELIEKAKASDETSGVYSTKLAILRAELASGKKTAGLTGANRALAQKKIELKIKKEESLLKQYPEYAARGTQPQPEQAN